MGKASFRSLSDHLLVIIDEVLGKNAKGGLSGGLASIRGKIAYVRGLVLKMVFMKLGIAWV